MTDALMIYLCIGAVLAAVSVAFYPKEWRKAFDKHDVAGPARAVLAVGAIVIMVVSWPLLIVRSIRHA